MVDPPPLVRPVEGPVASRFSYDRSSPFRRGRRRVVRFSVLPGADVRAPCSGRVTHAGRVPGGRAVAVRCGPWSVTLTGVAAAGVSRGRRVAGGTTVGRASSRSVGLGLRRASDAFAYVDPLPLLREPAPARRFVPLGPAPRVRPPATAPAPVRAVPRLRVPAPGPVVAPTSRPVAVPPPATPLAAWLGLALAALGLPAGAIGVRVRRRRSAARATVVRSTTR